MAGEQRLGDFVSLQRGTTYKGALVGKPGPALLGLGSIEPGGGFRHDFQTYGGDCPANLMCSPGDLYAALKGATKDGKMIGSVARVPHSVDSGRLTQDTVKLVFQDENVDVSNFVYWVLRTPQYRAYCAGHAMGSAVVALSRVDFLNYPIPALTPTRRKIVELLDALEAKIVLNSRMSESLESIARAIFKAWFVDFQPVRAKVEGRWARHQSIPGVPMESFDLFPDKLTTLENGDIPESWHFKPISDLADIVGGTTPSTNQSLFWEDGIHFWATPKDLAALHFPVLLQTERLISDAGLRQVSSGLLPVGTVLLSSRAPIGYLAITQIPVAINQGFIAMKPKTGISNIFLLLWAHFAHNEIMSRANGSTFLEISKSSFRPIPVATPSSDIMLLFEQIVKPMYARLVANEEQSHTLVSIRNTLLACLVSNEITLKKGEPARSAV